VLFESVHPTLQLLRDEMDGPGLQLWDGNVQTKSNNYEIGIIRKLFAGDPRTRGDSVGEKLR